MQNIRYIRLVGGGTKLQAGRSWIRVQMRPMNVFIFNLPNHSSRTMTLGLTKLLTDTSSRNLSVVKRVAGTWGWQPHSSGLTAICRMWDPRRLSTLWASMVCYGDRFTFFFSACNEIKGFNSECEYGIGQHCCRLLGILKAWVYNYQMWRWPFRTNVEIIGGEMAVM
jgi:hypothetical protein